MRRCISCGGTTWIETEVELDRTVAGRRFRAVGPGMRCAGCNEVLLPERALEAVELAIAADLAKNGPVTGEAFRFMRKVLGVPAVELAELLDVAPETVSRWENGRLPIERRALALLASMVLDRVEGATTTFDRLRSLRDPPVAPALVHLNLRNA